MKADGQPYKGAVMEILSSDCSPTGLTGLSPSSAPASLRVNNLGDESGLLINFAGRKLAGAAEIMKNVIRIQFEPTKS